MRSVQGTKGCRDLGRNARKNISNFTNLSVLSSPWIPGVFLDANVDDSESVWYSRYTNIAIVTIIVMAGNIIKKQGLTYLLGVCVPSAKQNAAKIRVKLPDFDTHLLMVVDVIYPLGDITDPITGKKVVAGKYRENIEKDAELYGNLESMYKYEKAPKRGITEGKRDFTAKKTYMKYSDDPKDYDPYAVNPS
ncbi:uncharacterized protein LOC122570046 isoform X4 [Bombus pyrosoma]|uniref:uncharacterized protein LOC122570046 isoform X4 n=1 Tax=Bombus pyrosoma TaxID=396416 RepID=UPI001CB90A86|nr:uncharacterized protein LOC122570046 isoform X4 [Bombus pyrosoma]